jgi:hypothetical protein
MMGHCPPEGDQGVSLAWEHGELPVGLLQTSPVKTHPRMELVQVSVILQVLQFICHKLCLRSKG